MGRGGDPRDNIIQLIRDQADRMHQQLDDDSMGKMTQLDDDQLSKLHEEFHDRLAHASRDRPIRNISALVVSITRGILSGRVSVRSSRGYANASTASGATAATLRPQASTRPPLLSPASFRAARGAHNYQQAYGGGRGRSVTEVLQQAGITGVDEAAVQKLEELAYTDMLDLISEFQQADSVQPIISSSKWLFARARSTLVRQRQQLQGATSSATGKWSRPVTLVAAPRAQQKVVLQGASHASGNTGLQELPELPGVLVDDDCVEKMNELEPEERDEVIEEYLRESAYMEIRNPSSWLFSKSRARIVIRVTGGRPLPRSGSGGYRGSSKADRDIFELGNPFNELADIGVDELAIEKLKELGSSDLQTLLVQFMELHSQNQVNDPSKWLYSRARTIAARVSQAQKGSDYHGSDYRDQRGSDYGGGVGTVPELKGVMLDNKALAKLDELEPEERAKLFVEYELEASRKSIQNPSGWVYGRARTKVVDRLTGKTKSERRRGPYY